ncbi:MAG: ABC transporter permease [Deltaproteobacteria bacterium]|jgi:putative ABC transport system permease protein|nr:ABC transporter permease [Deltaproteobacteria bacterium]
MTLKTISIKNLLRRKGKAGFILAGLVIGVSTVVGILTFVEAMTDSINHKLEKYGANILIVPKTENLALSYGGLALGGVSFEMKEIQEDELARIKNIKNARNVAALGPMVLGVVNIESQKVLMAGVNFKAAEILKPWWHLQGALPQENQMILGAEAARILNLSTGNQISIMDKELTVSGVLEPTGSQDDQLIFTRLATAQTIFDKNGRISMAEVAALCKDCPIEDMVKQISEALPGAKVMAIQQVVKGRMAALAQFKKFSYGISGVILLIGSLVVLVTMMGSVRERADEIGIFRAIGFRKGHIMKIVFIEASIVSGLAGIIGYFIGLGAAKVALFAFAKSHSGYVPFRLDLAVGAVMIALALGLVSSAYPAFMAARLDPNDALRSM